MTNLYPEDEILNTSKYIDNNIKKLSDDRKLLSSNLLQVLRNLTEQTALLKYNKENNCHLDAHYKNKKDAINFIKGYPKFKCVHQLYKYLEASASHYTPDDSNAERLILKYYLLLGDIKKLVKDEFNISILNNLKLYPLNTDRTFIDYYDKVAEKIEQYGLFGSLEYIRGRYYVERIKPFKSKGKIYYEVTLTKAIDNPSKFDRIIAFTQYRILQNYSIKVSFASTKINVFDGEVTIKIINNWIVNIRPCEIYNFGKIFGESNKITSNDHEYKTLMNYMTKNQLDLLDIVSLNDDEYNFFQLSIKGKEEGYITRLINNIRNVLINEMYGSNIIKYLIYIMKNRVIKSQIQPMQNINISNMYILNGSMMFEDMPFYMSLKGHNPDIDDLLMSIDSKDKEEEFLARYVKNNSEHNNKLYTPIQEVEHFGNLQELVYKFERRLYVGAKDSKLVLENSYIYIKQYEDKTLNVLREFFKLVNSNIDDYEENTDFLLNFTSNNIYEDNKEIIKKLFKNSCIAIIYGLAGTGKTTFIGDYCKLYGYENTKLLANTYSAVENLKRKVINESCFDFKAVKKYINQKLDTINCKTLIIDESSTVENDDMYEILYKTEYEKVLIVGDTCQIGSIQYGNWFNLACDLLPDFSKHFLLDTRRTTNDNLIEFWAAVRNGDDKITEILSKTDFNKELNNEILNSFDNDEVILCLNYNGLYGINNINKYMQDMNNEKSIEIGINTYKINDPIIFEDNNKYKNTLYNNLKGWIRNIEEYETEVAFTIEVEEKIDTYYAKYEGVEIINEYDNGHSLIKITIEKFDDSDEDEGVYNNNVVPFNVSYAISIHKAQGLEYNSVKIIISNDVQDLITKDIFYTAITRAKEKLHIFWSSESQDYIIKNLNNKDINLDVGIVKKKLGI